MIAVARLWLKITMAFTLLAHSDLVMADMSALLDRCASLEARCEWLTGEVQAYMRAFRALGVSPARGRHLKSVGAGEEPAA
jgi:hypothetical protein